ncbi:MAG TPA: HAMP domain-containing sensor histidine kinase [Shinella sp.]|jgi:sigma-B regulation protein RsbU (phosphoserine phosphatase)|uniref:PAS domain-containing sensor histidine kinase n=1 Tax=Shinella sp. TaxID=1870904 RepID=UPI002E14D8F7|nr:HAMP domain-containing sensor histidine kinase [Shinella sp.]
MDHAPEFRDLFDNAPCGYIVMNDRGRIVLVNATLRTWLDLDDTDLLGKRLLELLPVAGRVFYETHFAPLLRMQGYFHEVALDLVRRDRTRLTVLANATQRVDADGEVSETRIALFQATSRRKYERELHDANEAGELNRKEIERLNAGLTETGLLRDEFIAILGHDLRNPLASIGSGMRILSNEPLTPKGKQVVRLIEGSVTRMSKLINDVLDFTRGRLGGGIPVLRGYGDRLKLEFEQVVAEMESSSGRVIETAIDLPETTHVDASRIAQLVSNLLGNALAHGDPEKPISFSAHVAKGDLVITVENGGDPIAPEIAQRLFQPFFRGAGSRTASEQGLGLGLHIASEIAKAHGGTLSVTSGETTLFEFRMPNALG